MASVARALKTSDKLANMFGPARPTPSAPEGEDRVAHVFTTQGQPHSQIRLLGLAGTKATVELNTEVNWEWVLH